MVLPPLSGAVHDTIAEAFPAFAETDVGAAGVVTGVTAADGVDLGPLPTTLAAETANV